MSSPRKSTDCSASPDRHWSEDLARLHCLQALFPDWAVGDTYLLRQLKASIEASMRQQPDASDDFETFARLAGDVRAGSPLTPAASHAFVRIDFTGRTWDPLFARQEIVRELKRHAGTDQVFLMIRGLRKALFPAARYRTRARDDAHAEATRFIDQLARRWSTDSSRVHLLYL
jgi:hypothetical protein